MIKLTAELIISADIQKPNHNIANRWHNSSKLIREYLPPIPINSNHQHSKNPRHGKITQAIQKNNDKILTSVLSGCNYDHFISCIVISWKADDMSPAIWNIGSNHAYEYVIYHEEKF